MALQTMYPGKVGSPVTTLSTTITSTATTISVQAGTALPDAPNLATIGSGENAEVIRYGTKVGGTLSNVTRGFQGTAQSHAAGTTVARFLTEYDLSSLQDNVEGLTTGDVIAELANGLTEQARCSIRSTVNQSIPTAALQTVAFDTVNEDNRGMADLDNERIYIREKGTYLLEGTVWFDANATGRRMLYLYISGVAKGQIALNNNGTNYMIMEIVRTFPLNVGDYIELRAFQDSGGALNSTANGLISNILTVQKIS